MRMKQLKRIDLRAADPAEDTAVWVDLDAITHYAIVPGTSYLEVFLRGSDKSIPIRIAPDQLEVLCNAPWA